MTAVIPLLQAFVLFCGGLGHLKVNLAQIDEMCIRDSHTIQADALRPHAEEVKALFKEQWESLVGLCDEFLYLGGNEKMCIRDRGCSAV